VGSRTQPAEPTRRTRYRSGYQQVQPKADAVEVNDLVLINIDVTTARGALPEIMTLRERASKLPKFGIQHFDTLETYALATMHVQGEYVAASTPPEELIALNDQGIALREVLHSDAIALAKRGLMNGARLRNFKTGPGYKISAEDLVGLSSLLRHSWGKIGTKTAITMAELDQDGRARPGRGPQRQTAFGGRGARASARSVGGGVCAAPARVHPVRPSLRPSAPSHQLCFLRFDLVFASMTSSPRILSSTGVLEIRGISLCGKSDQRLGRTSRSPFIIASL